MIGRLVIALIVFAKEPRIEHLAWFSVAHPLLNTSDMVQADGILFPVGELWRQAASQ